MGAWAGGAAIDAGQGLRAPLWVGLGMALLGMLSLVPSLVQRLTLAPPPASRC